MIQIVPQAKIFVLHEAVSFHNGIDGLMSIAGRLMHDDPMDGSYFVFRGKSGYTARVLCFDGYGWWLATRRLSQGTFRWWPIGVPGDTASRMMPGELQLLLWGGDPGQTQLPPPWRRIA